MKLKDLLIFRDDLYFDGAVQADWFYSNKQIDAVASSFVFHGPATHAVSKEEVGGKGLMDTASFTLKLAEKIAGIDNGSPFTMPIAGYGTGKSHLAVTLSVLFSGEEFNPALHKKILNNISRADKGIANKIRPLVKNRRLVLTLNGMRDFNLHYELLRTAEKALRLNHVELDVLTRLNKLKETALSFLDRSYSILQDQFQISAKKYEIDKDKDDLLSYLKNNLDENTSIAFKIINEVYTEFNGHAIRLDEGVSATEILDTLLSECCGLHGQFDGIVILFDEFGRYLEYVSANPVLAGDSALQQIFESVQNSNGAIQFISFIQSDIKSYLQRVDKATNISRYIDRYDAGEKIYLSSNLETIFANLLDHPNSKTFNELIEKKLRDDNTKWNTLHSNIQKWLPLHGIWTKWEDFQKIILQAIYPLHPISTYLLCSLTDWLQSRSSLTLLNEKVKNLANIEVKESEDLPLIYPVELIRGSFFSELLSAEEQGRQRSQFCILLNNVYRRFETKMGSAEKDVLLANLIIRICRFKFTYRTELEEALCYCTGLPDNVMQEALKNLENEYAVLAYDDRMICFDFIADSIGATDFRNYIRAAKNKLTFSPSYLNRNDILELADISENQDTDFGARHGIQTREWMFKQRIAPISSIDKTYIDECVNNLDMATLPTLEKGLLIWIYVSRETKTKQIEKLQTIVGKVPSSYAIRFFILDDADNSLKDAIIEYIVLDEMHPSDRSRFQRFYDSEIEKSKDRLRMVFASLKSERKLVDKEGISPTNKRMKAYLTETFENVYPKAVPFDFEGFYTKTTTGNGYKNYFTIMRWILMDHMNYQTLKAQTTDLRNRVESVMGQKGLYSWKALTNEFKGTKPMQKAANEVYTILEDTLVKKRVISFDAIIKQWTKAPYGMNEYSIFMMVCLFCENSAYTSKLELEETRYSTDSWAELVIKDKRYDTKLFAKTKLRLIDITETAGQYKSIFNQIATNTDMEEVPDLVEQLNNLLNEETIPESMQSDLSLARMRLDEGISALKTYEEKTQKIENAISDMKYNLNAYTALKTCKDVNMMLNNSISSMYVYNPRQTEEMKSYINICRVYAQKSIDDRWIQTQICKDMEHLSSYKSFGNKVVALFESYGYSNWADLMSQQINREVERINLLMEQQALLSDSKTYLESSIVERGLTMKNLEALLERGLKLLRVFYTFDTSMDRRFSNTQLDLTKRTNDIRKAIQGKKNELAAAWDEISGIETVDDALRVDQLINSLLMSGLTEKDREDFENVDRFIKRFLEDVEKLQECSNETEIIDKEYIKLKNTYTQDEELDFSNLIEGVYKKRIEDVRLMESEWIHRFLELDISGLDQYQLINWKNTAQPWPKYLQESTIKKANKKLALIEKELSKQKISYIMKLIGELDDGETELLKNMLLRK